MLETVTRESAASTSPSASVAGPARHARSRWLVFGIGWAALSLVSILWSIATPIAAAPDEPAHLIKAASVARGQLIGESSEFGQVVQVPRYIAYTQAQTCFAFSISVTADCAKPAPGDSAALVDGTTTAGLYNPVYYVLVGWPSLLLPDESGLYAMRAMSGILCSLLLAGVVALVSTWPRRALPLLGLSFAITPMVLFLNGVINPNAFEVAAVLAVFTGMVSIIRFPDPELLPTRSALVAVGGLLAANSRGLSLVWLAIAVLVPLLFLHRGQLAELLRTTAVRLTILVVGLGTAFAVAWLAISNSLGAGVGDDESAFTAPSTGASPYVGFTWVLQRTFEFAEGMVGVIGWLDTELPMVIFAVWAMTVGTLLIVALVLLTGRRLLVTVALTASVVLVPALIQAGYVTGGGLIWQGRYNLPAFVCLLLGLGVMLADRLPHLGMGSMRRAVTMALLAWAGCHIYGFAAGLRRYSVAAEGTWRDVFTDPAWSPPGGIPLVLAIYSLAVVGIAAAVAQLALSPLRDDSGSDSRLDGAADPDASRRRAVPDSPIDESAAPRQIDDVYHNPRDRAGENGRDGLVHETQR